MFDLSSITSLATLPDPYLELRESEYGKKYHSLSESPFFKRIQADAASEDFYYLRSCFPTLKNLNSLLITNVYRSFVEFLKSRNVTGYDPECNDQHVIEFFKWLVRGPVTDTDPVLSDDGFFDYCKRAFANRNPDLLLVQRTDLEQFLGPDGLVRLLGGTVSNPIGDRLDPTQRIQDSASHLSNPGTSSGEGTPSPTQSGVGGDHHRQEEGEKTPRTKRGKGRSSKKS